MNFPEMFSLLHTPLEQFASSLQKTVSLEIKGSSSVRTSRVYELLSVFRNLFMNAVEASKKPHVSIRITLEEDSREVLLTVADDGPGIAPDALSQIFDAGFSTKINYKTGEVSRGLGLNIVKGIVEDRLGGSIQAVSGPGGASFSIRLPKETLEG